MMYKRMYASPVGNLLIKADEQGICAVHAVEAQVSMEMQDSPLIEEAVRQLDAYFCGSRAAFHLPLAPAGTAFEREVWQRLCGIPYGETRTYGQIAREIGRPDASRAVGRACGRNPLLIYVPCHRVVGAGGRLTGFAAGLAAKRSLLLLEGHRIGSDRILNT